MKKAIAVLTTIAVVGSTLCTPVMAKQKFSDVPDNAWYASYVNKLSDKGIISGYSSGKFGPNDSLKVAQVIKMVVSALGYKNLTYYDGYVNKAAALGLVQPGEFPDNKSLERNITRGEIARIVIRALKNEKYPSNLNDYKKLIKDYNSTPAKFQEFVLKAYALGIVSGGPSGDFSAGDTTTRAAASKIILNMIDPSMRTVPDLNTKGTVKKYDGITFDSKKDVDEYGRINVEKSKEFLLKLASQLTFVKENGKYYIKCTYPKIPEGYEWSMGISIYNKDGTHATYNPTTRITKNLIPKEGTFKKEVAIVKNSSNIESIYIDMAIDAIKTSASDDDTGSLLIAIDKEKTVDFVPRKGSTPRQSYPNFDLTKMFKW